MKWRDAGGVLGTALVTASVAVALLWMGQAVAKEGEQPEIQWPVLRHAGCQITLRADKTAYSPGEEPVVRLTAYNPAGSPASIEATLQMLVRPMMAVISRRMPSSKRTWEHKCRIALGAGERKTLTIPTGAKVSGGMVTFQMRVGKLAVNTRPLTVLAPAKSGQLAQAPRRTRERATRR